MSKNPLSVDDFNQVTGLFEAHDREGVHLTDSLIQCRERKLTPNLADFGKQARKAGWTPEKISGVIQNAASDAGLDVVETVRLWFRQIQMSMD